jgi:hypothetical protein
MEETTVASPEGSQQTAPEVATSSPETTSTEGSTQVSQSPSEVNPSQPEAYTPSYKFKVLDKEQEFDEWVRPVVKSKEHETKLRELYEKAHGLDHVKQGREQIKQEYTQYKEQWQPVIQNIAEASKFRQRAVQAHQSGDPVAAVLHYENMLKQLGISETEMKQYVFQKLHLEDLSPEAKREYNRRGELEISQMQAQDRLSQLEQQNLSLLKQQKTFEINQAISKPEVAQVQQAFDQANGKDAFWNEVVDTGYLMSQRMGREASIDEAISAVMKKHGAYYQQKVQQAATPQVSQQTVTEPADVPVIPTVKGANTSPAAKTFKTLADLEAYRASKYGS